MNEPSSENRLFGSWPSLVGPWVLSDRLRLEDVRWDSDGRSLLWLEGRSDLAVLVQRPAEGACRDLTGAEGVRGGVGYGGGEFTVSGGLVVYTAGDGRLYRRGLGRELPRPITPPFGRAASPAISPDGKWILYVFSDGHEDLLAVVDASGSHWPQKLVFGADFYMQPAWHPGGEWIAWVEWNHPNMPWDGTRLMLGRFSAAGLRVEEVRCLAGDAGTPAWQPQFSPDGRWLSYISSGVDWDRLVLREMASGTERVLMKGERLLLATPAWTQGQHTHGWSGDSQTIFSIRNYGGHASLWQVHLDGGAEEIDTAPYTWLWQLSVSPTGREAAFLASAPCVPDRVVRWDGRQLHVEARSDGENVPEGYLSQPLELEWPAPDGMTVHGRFYPPANPQYAGSGLPPAIVHIHGGPNSEVPLKYLPEALYFTSRGYGWMEVNYRGSSGYGRKYLQALNGRWGEADVEDAVGAARMLGERGLANPGRLVIHGGSAGGYTVLNALVRHPGTFKAGICLYGLSSLFTDKMGTHKFESHYTDRLVGELPGAAERYREWSPLYHAERIRDALAIFQGSEDRVVVPAQSADIARALQGRGVPLLYQVYEGEGHGFRRRETLADYLQKTERFLLEHVVYAP